MWQRKEKRGVSVVPPSKDGGLRLSDGRVKERQREGEAERQGGAARKQTQCAHDVSGNWNCTRAGGDSHLGGGLRGSFFIFVKRANTAPCPRGTRFSSLLALQSTVVVVVVHNVSLLHRSPSSTTASGCPSTSTLLVCGRLHPLLGPMPRTVTCPGPPRCHYPAFRSRICSARHYSPSVSFHWLPWPCIVSRMRCMPSMTSFFIQFSSSGGAK